MSITSFYNDLKSGDISEFLAASEVYQTLTSGTDKIASNGETMNQFFVDISKQNATSKHPSLDMETLQKLAEDVGVLKPRAHNAEGFINNIEFAAECGKTMAHDYIKQANLAQSAARFVTSNPRAAVGLAGAGVGAAGGYAASDGDGGAALMGGLAGGIGGALGGRKLVAAAARKTKPVLGKGVQGQLRGAMTENAVRRNTKTFMPSAASSEMKQVALPGMEGAVGAKPLQHAPIPQPRQAPVAGPVGQAPNPAQGELFAPRAGVNPYAPNSRTVAPTQPGLFGRAVNRAKGMASNLFNERNLS